MLSTKRLFYFYRRYIWSEDDFGTLQDTLAGYPAALFSGLCSNAVLSGFKSNGSSGLIVNYKSGVAVNTLGDLLSAAADGTVTVTDNVKSLVVARPVNTNTNTITRPTAPFDPVPLNKDQAVSVVAIAGTLGAYPATVAGDVVLFGVTASAGSISQIDDVQCNLIGKSAELVSLRAHHILVGTTRDCDYRTLAEALAVAVSGDKIRVRNGETINTTIVCSTADVEIECDPGVAYVKGTAATGFTFSANGIRFKNGRISGFSTAGNKAINITSDYCMVFGTRFANNDSDVVDVDGNSTSVGVINE